MICIVRVHFIKTKKTIMSNQKLTFNTFRGYSNEGQTIKAVLLSDDGLFIKFAFYDLARNIIGILETTKDFDQDGIIQAYDRGGYDCIGLEEFNNYFNKTK